MFEALREAKFGKRQIVVSWIDLANAYGSVRHNLVQFALNWYHVPVFIQHLIFDYYEKLSAVVITPNWSTEPFSFDIGLFQGCVLSTILFDCVFQLLLDFLQPLESLGFSSKLVESKQLLKAYADDLAITTKDSASNQKVCDQMCRWLDWSKTMKAKPSKCVAFGMRQFDKRTAVHRHFTPFSYDNDEKASMGFMCLIHRWRSNEVSRQYGSC